MPEGYVNTMMDLLRERGYATVQDGVLKVSRNYYEFQSQSGKEELRSYHKSVMRKAHETLESKKSQADLDRRLVTSSTMTCSKENIERLKLKIADFLKEFAEESSAGEPEEVYQFGIQFFPVTTD